MLFHIAKLAQGTDTAFRIKIQLKYHLWEEKTFFSQCEEYMYMCVCIYIYIYFFFFSYHGPYQRQPPTTYSPICTLH